MNRLKSSLPFSKSSSATTPREESEPTAVEPEANTLISQRRELYNSLYSSFESYYKYSSKERTDPRNEASINLSAAFKKRGGEKDRKELPIKWFGQAMKEGAQLVGGDDLQYQTSLSIIGDLHDSLGDLTCSLNQALKQGYLELLEKRLESLKLIEKLENQVEKKFSTLESYKSKMEKSKKSRQDVEHELDQLEWAYQDSVETLERKVQGVENSTEEDVEALNQLVEIQFDFATNYIQVLQQAKDQLSSSSPTSSSHRNPLLSSKSKLESTTPRSTTSASTLPSPRSRSSSTLQTSSNTQTPTTATTVSSTRMSRSFSDSSTTNGTTGGGFGSNLLFKSSLGPGRSRRSTVSSSSTSLQQQQQQQQQQQIQTLDEKEKSVNSSRSRSGSVLERFALTGGGNKKKNNNNNNEEEEEGTSTSSSRKKNTENNRSRSGSNSSSTSRWNVISTPSLPSLSSFSRGGGGGGTGSPSSKHYGALKDTDFENDHYYSDDKEQRQIDDNEDDLPSRRRIVPVPPQLKRTQTAPPLFSSPSSSSALTPSSPLRQSSPVPLPRRIEPSVVVGKTYLTKWPYQPSATQDDDVEELSFSKNELIRVEKEINKDWWIGKIVGTGRKGMFPSAYVVPHETQERDSDEDEDEDQWERTAGGNESLRSFVSTSTLPHQTSTTDGEDTEDGEDEEEEEVNQKRPFTTARVSNRPSLPLPPRSTANGVKKAPPPPPPRRTNSSNFNGRTVGREEETEGSPFD
ncbi:hypothetical protein JCM3765_006084 [Sporobolomyces pararoseus]